jgi:prephenate dehydratase
VESIRTGKAQKGMMAVENTISGTLHSNLNLIRESGLRIVGEEYLRIRQNLVVLPGTTLDRLEQVSSHYMALNQCRVFLNRHPHLQLVEAADTAVVMREIAQKRNAGLAAIGSSLAAEEYGLEVLVAGIETNKRNYTRFLVVEHGRSAVAGFNKSSLSLTLRNRQGTLSHVLSIMAFYGLDLSKIESLPIIGEPWHYRFYVDLLVDDRQQYRHMLSAVRPLVDQLVVLGEYIAGIDSFNKIHTQP